MKKRVIIVSSTKGGVGKSTTAWQSLPAYCALQNQSFQVFEVDDNNNTSRNFPLSEIILQDNCKTVKTDNPEIAANIVIETIASNDLIIMDGGGGNDSIATIKIGKSLGDDVSKLWLIPFDRTEDDFEGALQTAELINDPTNTYFVLNGFNSKTKHLEFEWFYKLGIKNYIEIPYSDLFSYAQKNDQTIFDLAQISQNMDKAQAKKIFAEQFTQEGELDKDAFKAAFNDFLKSELAVDVVEQINQSFSTIFEEKEQEIGVNSNEEKPRAKKSEKIAKEEN